MKRLQWKDEDLEHERKSRLRMETELNHKVRIITLYTSACMSTHYRSVHEIVRT